ncbi:adenylate kinase [Frankia sp. R43]|uniref:adenylate kinase n=1 Tax=Frankia sp. R43 TaxID=269536 RepID=UPI0006CA1E1C|nr:adenylate kinase [Frankia sp. R43]KPM54126.1 adenylate kinase [Frankia sp. R43]
MDAQRVLVVGSGGAGKSTLSRRLGELWELPVVHLDQHFWSPGWVEMPDDAWREVLTRLLGAPQWIMDGNYAGTLDLRLPAADLILFLDLPRRVTVPRVLWRRIRWHGRTRPDVRPGCPEHVTGEFLAWLWTYPRSGRVRLVTAITEADAWSRVVRLRSPRQVRRWLALEAQPGRQDRQDGC